ncbi:hypothetical protein [Rhizobium leguminosarum]|uniref:Uncharacterized protein n=1 Tax=Rhizobium leguminosarum TaxID=384 RepID=A0A1L3Z4A5_RHILE|nr:hypothetical protein [Rhizobium leguminosarum]API50447.1 hypothetical protein BMW22_01270 [Rhizobium leguminosarum]MBY5676248.1 hypothetical protein [Rhizobium leguminosarum]MBY5716840.1 hypothetical protein [Rhizobium leguminosarum]
MIIEARFRPGFFLFAGVSIPAWLQCRNRSLIDPTKTARYGARQFASLEGLLTAADFGTGKQHDPWGGA